MARNDDTSSAKHGSRSLLSFLLALLMHVALAALLFVGVSWQKPEPDIVQAELWIPTESLPEPEPAPAQSAPPDEPAPTPTPPPEPPPPPPAEPQVDPAIAIEQARREQERQEREEQERRQTEAEKVRQEAEARERERIEAERKREEERRQREAEERREREEAERKKAEAEKKRQEELKKQEEERKERERKQAEQKRLAEEKAAAEKAAAEKAAAEKAAAQKAAAEKAAAEKAAEQRKAAAEARRKAAVAGLLNQAGSEDATATHGSTSGARDGGYAARVSSAIRANTVFSQHVSGNPQAVFEVRIGAGGKVLGVELTRPSGNPAWDSAAERAIRRTNPFPCPRTGSCEGTLEIHHGPQD